MAVMLTRTLDGLPRLIYANVVDKWLNMLEGYFSVHNFYDRENITFALLKVVPHVKDWWDT
jgi:hypothetical protein